MSPPVIVDTNVVAAGLLAGRSDSPVAVVLDGMLSAAFPFVISPALLAEYRAVLTRAKLTRLHGLAVAEVETLLVELARHAVVIEPAAAAIRAPDRGDQLLWDLLAARAELVLVTGDKRLIDAASMRGRVATPADFMQRLERR